MRVGGRMSLRCSSAVSKPASQTTLDKGYLLKCDDGDVACSRSSGKMPPNSGILFNIKRS